jgi:hypothetical protein
VNTIQGKQIKSNWENGCKHGPDANNEKIEYVSDAKVKKKNIFADKCWISLIISPIFSIA